MVKTRYTIEGNFRGAKYSWFSWLKVWPRMKRPYLQCKQQPRKNNIHKMTKYCSTTNILSPRKLPAIRYMHTANKICVIVIVFQIKFSNKAFRLIKASSSRCETLRRYDISEKCLMHLTMRIPYSPGQSSIAQHIKW